MREIYLDHNATTPLHPRVKEAWIVAMEEFGNPSSQHAFGRRAAQLCEQAREEVALLLGAADPHEICFTGSGSEANALGVYGALEGLERAQPRGRPLRVVSSRVEHSSVLEAMEVLRSRTVEVDLIPVDSRCQLDLDALRTSLQTPTDLVTVMLANNEVGTIQPVREIARLAREAGALVHIDAVQGVGKVPVDVEELGVDLLASSAHKMNGPKGIGVLYIRRGVPIRKLIPGGGQEHGRRAGTTNTPGLVATGMAARVARERPAEKRLKKQELRDRLWNGVQKTVDGVRRYGDPQSMLPGTLGLSFDGLRGDPVLLRLDMEGIAVSSGSACHSGSGEPSHVLSAMGVSRKDALGFLRLSLGLGNTAEDVDRVLEVLSRVVEELRVVGP